MSSTSQQQTVKLQRLKPAHIKMSNTWKQHTLKCPAPESSTS